MLFVRDSVRVFLANRVGAVLLLPQWLALVKLSGGENIVEHTNVIKFHINTTKYSLVLRKQEDKHQMVLLAESHIK